MPISTKKGDNGMTSLFGSGRKSKSYIVFDLLGKIDRLNVNIGKVYADLKISSEHKNILCGVQMQLMAISSDLATSPESKIYEKTKYSDNGFIYIMENAITSLEKKLPTLKNFVIPNELLACKIHTCRVDCRDAERTLTSYYGSNSTHENKKIRKMLNRLSDLFFMFSREYTIKETIYKP